MKIREAQTEVINIPKWLLAQLGGENKHIKHAHGQNYNKNCLIS